MQHDLIKKYNVPAPRYTSYPTVPYWSSPPEEASWMDLANQALQVQADVSLYIHLPFCENLCTYCGCNKRITQNHKVEFPYIQAVLDEWNMYQQAFDRPPTIRDLHLGGGTPTFFSPNHLGELVGQLLASASEVDAPAYSFEAHPSSTTHAHLEQLYARGFRRLSIGVQDFSQGILNTINRYQTTEQVEQVTAWARAIGYESINYDLIFGLPFQTPENIRANMAQVARLQPERIAFYSYAHVPWIKPAQRAYSEKDLPKGEKKRALYELGRQLLAELGYDEIGMDHFALPGDELHQAWKGGSMHRNFMGYTPFDTRLQIGLGASSISDSWTAYVQNEKSVEAYQQSIQKGNLPLVKGHCLSPEDQVLRRHILNLICRFETRWEDPALQHPCVEDSIDRLGEMIIDGLVELTPFTLRITEAGRPFVRNVCMAFDRLLWENYPDGQIFSKVV